MLRPTHHLLDVAGLGDQAAIEHDGVLADAQALKNAVEPFRPLVAEAISRQKISRNWTARSSKAWTHSRMKQYGIKFLICKA
jgi:hypothetical protein